LGCGAKTSSHPSVVNVDWSILLRIRSSRVLRVLAPLFLNGERLERLHSLPANILPHDLSKGVPFPNDSVDAVYHSHVLEHLDRELAHTFMREVRRVLKPGGVHRIVVPDFERYCRAYLESIALCEKGAPEAINTHDQTIEPILLQSVRREASGTSQQNPTRRLVENLLLGDARKRGETHQWMYDRFNLGSLLRRNGFGNVTLHSFRSSAIPGWDQIRLDVNNSGSEYKPESLYMEAQKL
jgi:SAM-dependent methyltransferase